MRKICLFLTFTARFILWPEPVLPQAEKISLKWLREQKTDYTQRWDPETGWKMPPVNWGSLYIMPVVGLPPNPVHYQSIPGGIWFTRAETDTETGNCRLEGFIALAHQHQNNTPNSSCLPLENNNCHSLEKLPEKDVSLLQSTGAIIPDYNTVSLSEIPCYTKNQAPVEIYLFERHFYWGNGIPAPSIWGGFSYTIFTANSPPPEIYHTIYDNPDTGKNKGYPVIVKKIPVGKTDSLGKFSLEFKLNKKQHLMIGDMGFDLRQVFYTDFREHPKLDFFPHDKSFSLPFFEYYSTGEYLVYKADLLNSGNCDVKIESVIPAYSFMKARPADDCIVKTGKTNTIYLWFKKERETDISADPFTVFFRTDKGGFSFPARIANGKSK